jgi:hypothetical protein
VLGFESHEIASDMPNPADQTYCGIKGTVSTGLSFKGLSLQIGCLLRPHPAPSGGAASAAHRLIKTQCLSGGQTCAARRHKHPADRSPRAAGNLRLAMASHLHSSRCALLFRHPCNRNHGCNALLPCVKDISPRQMARDLQRLTPA